MKASSANIMLLCLYLALLMVGPPPQRATAEPNPVDWDSLTGNESSDVIMEAYKAYKKRFRHKPPQEWGNSSRYFEENFRVEALEPLRSDDPHIRRNALRELGQEIAKEKPGTYLSHGAALIPYLSYSLQDPNEEFSRSAANILYLLGWTTAQRSRFIPVLTEAKRIKAENELAPYPLLSDYRPLKESLMHSLKNSPVEEVRALSAETLVLAFGPTKDLALDAQVFCA